MPRTSALILYGATDIGANSFSSDLLWRTGFRAPDPFYLIEMGGRTTLLVSDLELERAKKEAAVDRVVAWRKYHKPGIKTTLDAVGIYLEKCGVKDLRMPSQLPYSVVAKLKSHFRAEIIPGDVYPERIVKTAREIAQIREGQAAVEHAMHLVRRILARSRIRKSRLYLGGRVLSSEFLRESIQADLYRLGWLALGTIVAGGKHAADPHCEGTGPLRSATPIVIDVFPLSVRSHYYADCTRTFYKGGPDARQRAMYETVRQAQELALSQIRGGVDGYDIQQSVAKFFHQRGYPTRRGRSTEGFIHGVGHGVGLDIHEAPRIGGVHVKLPVGSVVTVEPGLYYQKASAKIPSGGVRIEDMVMVTATGYRNLCSLPKDLSWAVL
ncbi:MAG: aminopeptidase P family protein [Candidatus Liptonbacteria bacterium]|nr:aminopeptidase P family protein [Candidatus Liptonbacteria bacterium]